VLDGGNITEKGAITNKTDFKEREFSAVQGKRPISQKGEDRVTLQSQFNPEEKQKTLVKSKRRQPVYRGGESLTKTGWRKENQCQWRKKRERCTPGE